MPVETEAFQDALGNAGNVTSTARGEGLLQLGVAFHDGFPIALVEGRVHHLRFDGGDFFLEFLKLTTLPTEFFLDGGVGFQVPNLSQVCEADSRSELDVTGVLLLLADGVEEGGFSSPVVANDANTVSVVDLDVDIT